MKPSAWLLIYIVGLGVMSLITLAVFAWDKRRARRHGWRVSEQTLHTLELLGGWPGAWLAMRWLRHKSIKRAYRFGFGLMVALHLAVVGCVVWWGWFR